MYLAQKIIDGKTHFFLRESYRQGNAFLSRDLLALGENPGAFIDYPGGNAYMIHASIEETLLNQGASFDWDDLDDIFWPFLRPDIQYAVGSFRHRDRSRSHPKKLSKEDEANIRQNIPSFDKRRLHYLKYGTMGQGPVVRMPAVMFRHLTYKSRDEIEQYFITEEEKLRPSELKTYMYVALDLQRFFPNFLAAKMPQALDQNRVDAYFIEEICHLNRHLFQEPEGAYPPQKRHDLLHPYLIRYVCMFFDHEYAGSYLLDDFVKDFIYRHRFHKPSPPPSSMGLDKASRIFGVSTERLKDISRKKLARLYRRKAMKLHPDVGGSQKEFVALTEAYHRLRQHVKG